MKMKNWKKTIAYLCTAVMLTAGLTACGKDNNEGKDNENQPTGSAVSGTIRMSGSTSMEKLVNAFMEDYMSKNDKVTITPEFTGSSAGVEGVLNGTVDIGNASRELKQSEKDSGATENIVAIDGIAVIIDKANTVTNITKDQLIGIYTGTIKNWSELGGSDSPIVVVGREAGSGTRGAFEEILEVTDICKYANELDNTGAVVAKVASTPGAIGYVSLDVLDDTVVAVSLDETEATVDNIKSGAYFLSRPFVMATKGAISEQSDLIKAFFDYVYSEDGKAVIEAVGLIIPD